MSEPQSTPDPVAADGTDGTRREARFERIWYGSESAPLGWRLAALLYRMVSGLRRLSYRLGLRRKYRAPVPVIVVGNVTVGGTGKTPVVMWLYQQLLAQGHQPGVMSRGYGGQQQRALAVEVDMPATLCGDEPLMMARRGVRVVVSADRSEAAEQLLAQGCDVLIADDGLQHHRLHRDLEIAVVDGERGLGNGKLLPAGPLREPASALRRVDWVVVNGGQGDASTANGAVTMQLSGDTLYNAASNESQALSDWRGRQVHAVAGIGNPERFFRSLERAGLSLIRHPFSDHHAFSPDDLKFGDSLPVVTTEKDAVRIPPDSRIWYLPVQAQLPAHLFAAIHETLWPAQDETTA